MLVAFERVNAPPTDIGEYIRARNAGIDAIAPSAALCPLPNFRLPTLATEKSGSGLQRNPTVTNARFRVTQLN